MLHEVCCGSRLDCMNPYRMPKPVAGVLLRGVFWYADDRGRIDDSGGVARVQMTADYLWVSDNLSVPLASIRNVENLNGRAIAIAFHNALSNSHELVCLAARDWIGLRNKALNNALATGIEQARRHARSPAAFEESLRDRTGDLDIGCEICGHKPGRDVELGWFLCLGLLPVAGLYYWRPVRRFLCVGHASRMCLANNLRTGLVGFLGFPGILVAPYRLWRNVKQLNAAFGSSASRSMLHLMAGLVPALAVIGLFVWIIVRRM